MPSNEIELFIASPIASHEQLIQIALAWNPDSNKENAHQFSQINSHFVRAGVPTRIARVYQSEVVSTDRSILGILEDRGLVVPVIGSWVRESAGSLAGLLGERAGDGTYVSGVTVRDKSGSDFFAYEVGNNRGWDLLQTVALDLVSDCNFAPLTLSFRRGDGLVVVDWDGHISVSDTSERITKIKALDRYAAIRDRFSLRFLPVGPDTLSQAGFGKKLIDLYLANNTWSSLQFKQQLTEG